MFEQIAEALKPFEPVLGSVRELLAPLAPIHAFMSQRIYGPLNYYMLTIIVLQLLSFLFPTLFDYRPKVIASHILMKDEKAIKDVRAILEKDPTQFAALAEKHSVCPSAKNGGRLGAFARGQMVKEFEAFCFDEAMPVGQVSPVIKTQFGYHLIWVHSKPGVKKTA
ncbi:hypothetical protein HDU83_001235 [Entophlyctis luteolus]|nr:hypothetical protein HDU83_001235 [Entophlyctis luteolus]KAJ3388459.1 hypothetical protein HDU84_009733 [Entophlyctis sp. JEL0112]